MISNQKVRPRALTYRGVVMASGWWLDPTLCGEDEARRRILSNWETGTRVFETAGGYLLRFALPRLMRIESTPAVVIVEENGWLLGAPLHKSEWEALQKSETRFAAQKLVLVRGGELFQATDPVPVDVSLWLNVDEWQSEEMQPLGEIPAVKLAIPAAQFEARHALDVPASPELLRFLAELRGEVAPEPELPAWWQRFFGKRTSRDKSAGFDAPSNFAQRKPRFSLGWLFRFGFGAAGDAPPLRQGEHFSSEFGIVARYFGVGGVLVVLLCVVRSLLSLGGDIGFGLQLLAFLALGALLAWGLLVVSRLFPAPQNYKPTPKSEAGLIPFDLLGFLLFCCSVFVYFLLQGDWLWVFGSLLVALIVAVKAHWELRRSDDDNYSSQGFTWSGGGLGGLIGLLKFAGFFAGLLGGDKEIKSGDSAASPIKGQNARASWLKLKLWQTQLARLFGGRQAQYMMRMMEMFERGDLDAALKHAVPFNMFGGNNSSPALGLPRPRTDLDFLGPRASGGSSILLPDEIRTRLTQYYRSAHETLAAQKRIDEAAFVLAELLDSPEEAVQYLEKNESWSKAAQLAETRGMDTGLTVRLWWLAGDRNRAVVVARRTGAFRDAIARLEKMDEKHRDSALALRLIWAHSLALGGDYANAVEAAWPTINKVPDAIGFIGVWIERGLEGTDSTAARMLGRQAHLLERLSPQTVNDWQLRVKKLLADNDLESVGHRLQFADLVSGAPAHDLARAAARRTARSLTRDAAHFPTWTKELQEKSKKLIDFAGDGSLRIDWAALSFPQSSNTFSIRDSQIRLQIEASDVGALPIHDAAYLPDGRMLLALGEAGARLLNRKGETTANFDQPCHRLVTSSNGERAIGVALRGLEMASRFQNDNSGLNAFINLMGVREYNRRAGLARLCRFDLTRKTVEFWGEVSELSAFAPTLNGSQWMITSGDAISSIDTTANGPLALWRTAEAGYHHQMHLDTHSLSVLAQFHNPSGSKHYEVWRFDAASLMLRERRRLPIDNQDRDNIFVVPGAYLLLEKAGQWNEISIGKEYPNKIGTLEMPKGEKAVQVEVCGDWLAILSQSNVGSVIRLMKWHNKSLKCHITLGDSQARIRLTEVNLTVVDNRGRLITIDLITGTILKNSRLF